MAHYLFGGTFDPPHLGHSRIIDELLSLAGSESSESRVTVIPSFHPPAKNPPLLSFAKRLRLCQQAFEPLDRRVSVTDIEATLEPPSYFIHTVDALKSATKCTMVIGFDQLRSLHKWHQATELFAKVDLLVLDREQATTAAGAEDDRAVIYQQLARFGVTVPKDAHLSELSEPIVHKFGRFQYLPFDQPQSSTAIRGAIKEGKLTELRHWLHPEVFAALTDPTFFSS